MNIGLGNNVFTLPITSIKQLFRLTDESSIVKNTNGAEMIITACPLCKYNLIKNGADIPVVYFTELLAEALGVKEDTNE